MSQAYRLRARAEHSEIMKEYSAALEAVGMGSQSAPGYPREHIEARRLWQGSPDTRSLTGVILGDPIPARSALAHQKSGAGA